MKTQDNSENNPLEILLELLERENLDISNFSLAQVADDYLNFLNKSKIQERILENISEFLWVASRLALLKSKILVSTFNFEEIQKEEEPEEELKERLIKYKKFKEISKVIGEKFIDSEELASRKKTVIPQQEFSLNFGLVDLRKTFVKVISNFKIDSEYLYQKKTVREVIKIEERINQIHEMLKRVKSFNFSKTIFKKSSKNEIVVSFLSVLELVKQGTIQLEQKECFREMKIIRKEIK